jgi:hypothetical protein
MLERVCCIVGCSRPCCSGDMHPDEAVCAEHLEAASPAVLNRLKVASRRRGKVESYWRTDALYESVIASGRYLKLCDTTRGVSDQAESAWIRFKLDLILGDARNSLSKTSKGLGGTIAM